MDPNTKRMAKIEMFKTDKALSAHIATLNAQRTQASPHAAEVGAWGGRGCCGVWVMWWWWWEGLCGGRRQGM